MRLSIALQGWSLKMNDLMRLRLSKPAKRISKKPPIPIPWHPAHERKHRRILLYRPRQSSFRFEPQ